MNHRSAFHILSVLCLLIVAPPALSSTSEIHGYRVVSSSVEPNNQNKLKVQLEVEYTYRSTKEPSGLLDAWVLKDGAPFPEVTSGKEVVNVGRGKATVYLWFDPSRSQASNETNAIAFGIAEGWDGVEVDKSRPLRTYRQKFTWGSTTTQSMQVRGIERLPADLRPDLFAFANSAMKHPSCASNCKEFEVSCVKREGAFSRADIANGLTDGQFVTISWLRFGPPTLGGVPGAMIAPGAPSLWNEQTVRLHYRKQGPRWSQIAAESISLGEACGRR